MSEENVKGRQIPCFVCQKYIFSKGYGHHLQMSHHEEYKTGIEAYPEIRFTYEWPEAVAARSNQNGVGIVQANSKPSKPLIATRLGQTGKFSAQIKILSEDLTAAEIVDLFSEILKAKYVRVTEALKAFK